MEHKIGAMYRAKYPLDKPSLERPLLQLRHFIDARGVRDYWEVDYLDHEGVKYRSGLILVSTLEKNYMLIKVDS